MKEGLGHQVSTDLRMTGKVQSDLEEYLGAGMLKGTIKVNTPVYAIICDTIDKLADLAIREDDKLNENC